MSDQLHLQHWQQVYPADQNPVLSLLADKASKHTRRNYRRYLDQIAAMFGVMSADVFAWPLLRHQHTGAIRTRLIETGKAPQTVNGMLSALRAVLEKSYMLDYMNESDYKKAAAVANVADETLPAGRSLSAGELRALVDVCLSDQNTAAGTRDAAVLAVLRFGLRRAEVAALGLTDLDPDTGRLEVRHAKGNKQRVVYITGGALLALRAWLARRGAEDGPLFGTVYKSGKLGKMGLSANAIYNLLAKRIKEAGIANASPHDLRRSLVGDMLVAGVDITLVAKFVGHSSVNTTMRYDRRTDEDKERAADMIHFPFGDGGGR